MTTATTRAKVRGLKAVGTIMEVLMDQIDAGDNDRKRFGEGDLADLAASIAENGLIQPITVRRVGDRFQIVAGERRFRAHQVLGLTAIRAMVEDLDDDAASAVMLTENTGRVGLTAVEEAHAYQKRIEFGGWSVEQVARVAGVSTDIVRRRMSLTKLLPEVHRLIETGQLPIGHAEVMAGLDNERQRMALRFLSRSGTLTLDVFRRYVSELKEQQEQESMFDLTELWVQQVQATAGAKSGKAAAVAGRMPVADLPDMQAGPVESTGAGIERYIGQLRDGGHEYEAKVMAKLYAELVRGNWVRMPDAPVRS